MTSLWQRRRRHDPSSTAHGPPAAGYAARQMSTSDLQDTPRTSAEIHRRRRWWHPYIPQVSCRIPRRNIQSAAHGDGKMLKIAAHSEALCINVQSGLGWTGMLRSEVDSRLHPVANRMHPRKSGRCCSKQLQCDGRESVNLAVTAVVKIAQSVVRQFLDGNFARIRALGIGLT
jgi:hypothetical protein